MAFENYNLFVFQQLFDYVLVYVKCTTCDSAVLQTDENVS